MGPAAQNEFCAALVIDADAQDITRQEIACKLHATKLTADSLCQRSSKRRFANPRNVLDEEMPAGEKCHERELDRLVLSLEGPSTACRNVWSAGSPSAMRAAAAVMLVE